MRCIKLGHVEGASIPFNIESHHDPSVNLLIFATGLIMSLKSLLQAGINSLFGTNQNSSSSKPPAQTNEVSAKIPDIAVIKEALIQIKEMTQIFALVEYAAIQLSSKGGSTSEDLKILLSDATRLSRITENNLVGYIPSIQGCETIQRNAAIAGKMDVELFKPLVISTTAQFSNNLALCPKYVELISALQTIQPIPRADEIETRLHTAITKGADMSVKLSEMIFKYFDLSSENQNTTPQPN
jgi:hypothetical protein